MMRRAETARRGAWGWLAMLWAGAALAAAGSCAPPPEPEARVETAPAQAQASSPVPAAQPAPVAGAADATAASEAEIPPPPPPAGLEAADIPMRETGGDAPGEATAYWGGSRAKVGAKSPWSSIAGDGRHDPTSEAVGLLQEPRTAMRGFPRANSGNYVDWVKTLEAGLIRPRARTGSAGAMEVLDLDVVMTNTKSMPTVRFSHRIHTEWLSCSNCHDWLFKKQAGTTPITMKGIFRRQTCGLCHGRVAFPPDECFRCHNGPRPG